MSTLVFIGLCAASLAPDAVDLLYSFTGICSPYGLYSHTVPAVVLQAALIGGVTYLASGSRALTGVFVAVVMLHMLADYLTGSKLLWPGGEFTGLNLYEVPLYDFLLEAPVLVAGWWTLRRSGRGPGWTSSIWALVVLALLQATFDATNVGKGGRLKPSRCYSSAPRYHTSGLVTDRATS